MGGENPGIRPNCQLSHIKSAAIEARKLEIAETEWSSVTGESVEIVRREIARLEKLL